MTKSEVIKLLTMLAAAYPNMKEVTELQVRLWYESLKDIPVEVGLANARKHIMTSQFPPTIAEILGTSKNNANRFHNFKQHSVRYTEEEIEAICKSKRDSYYLKLRNRETPLSIEGKKEECKK